MHDIWGKRLGEMKVTVSCEPSCVQAIAYVKAVALDL